MTSKRLRQLRDLRMEIRDLQERLHDEQLPADMKGIINKRLQKCLEEGRELVRFIDAIEDHSIREIILCRFADGNSWEKVAFRTGSCSKDAARRRCERFLKGTETKK
ncbi:MAG: hypothetical protein KHW59_02485 [Clostridiales bacterium]|nr:hypothetical protein [Clostridiales bacterium]